MHMIAYKKIASKFKKRRRPYSGCIFVYNTVWFYMQVPQGNSLLLANTQRSRKRLSIQLIDSSLRTDWNSLSFHTEEHRV